MALTEEERKERRREYGRAWYAANKERDRERHRIWYEANKERVRERYRIWCEANKERKREASRAWYEANKERVRDSGRAWREANKKRYRDTDRAYHEANKERARAITSASTGRKRGAEIDPFLKSELGIQAVIDLQRSATECRYCRSPLDIKTQHIDHITPIARGGKHELSNLAITCATCNLIKHNRTEGEYREYMATEMLERVKRVSGAA